MANPEHVEIVKQGADAIRKWREENPDVRLDLRDAILREVDLHAADLSEMDFSDVDIRRANLRKAVLREATLRKADLRGADLRKADLRKADLREANLRNADLRDADLRKSNLCEADLRKADVRGADLREADLCGADSRFVILGGGNLEDRTRGYQPKVVHQGRYRPARSNTSKLEEAIIEALPRAAEALVQRKITSKEETRLRAYYDQAAGTNQERALSALRRFTGLTTDEFRKRVQGLFEPEAKLLSQMCLQWNVCDYPPTKEKEVERSAPDVNMQDSQEVSCGEATAHLILEGGPESGRSFDLDADETTIGRHPDCRIVLAGFARISRYHAEILRNGKRYHIKDLHSRNGTYLNGERIKPHKSHALNDGDRICLSDQACVFKTLSRVDYSNETVEISAETFRWDVSDDTVVIPGPDKDVPTRPPHGEDKQDDSRNAEQKPDAVENLDAEAYDGFLEQPDWRGDEHPECKDIPLAESLADVPSDSVSELPILSWGDFLEACADDRELADELISVFLEESHQDLNELRKALYEGDADLARKPAYRQKSNARIFAAAHVESLFARIEDCAKANNLSDAQSLLPELEVELNRLWSALLNDKPWGQDD